MLIGTAEPDAMVPTIRLQRVAVKMTMLLAAPICVLGLIAVGIGFAQVARTGDWQHLWNALLGSARYAWLVALLPSLSGWLARPQLRGALPALERAAMRGDARLAPLAAQQPAPSTSPEHAEESVTLGRLRMARDDLARSYEVARWGLYGLVLVAALLAVELTVLLVLLGITTAESRAWAIPLVLAVGLVAGLALFGGVSVYLGRKARQSHQIAQRLRAGLRIQADAEGLRWVDASSGQKRRLPWHEARAFYLITAPEERPWAALARRWRRGAAEPQAMGSLYALAGEQARLLWAAPTSREPEALAEHRRLCELIATQTRLPLRDLSTATVSLAHALRFAMNGRNVPPDEQATLRALGLPPADLPLEHVRRRTQRLSRFSLALLAPFFVMALVGVVGSILQHVRIG
jgi:hypothetical protein